jgi:hypothetical protein
MSRQNRPPREANRDRTPDLNRRKEPSDPQSGTHPGPDQGPRGDERSQRHDRTANRRTESEDDEEW